MAYLSKVENGKAKPSKAFLQKVAERLNVSFDMIGNPSSESFQQKLETSLASIEAEKRTLTDEEESLLKMAFIEFVQPLLLVRIVTVLLRNALDKRLLQEADAVYEASIKLIDPYTLESAIIYNNLSLVKQRVLEDKTLALFYSEKAYEIFKKHQDLPNLIDILKIKLQLKEWEAVKRLLDETLLLTQKHRMASVEVELHWIKANIFKERGDDFNYEKYIKDAIEKAENIGFQLLVKDMAKELVDYYYDYRFYKKAAKYYALALSNA